MRDKIYDQIAKCTAEYRAPDTLFITPEDLYIVKTIIGGCFAHVYLMNSGSPRVGFHTPN